MNKLSSFSKKAAVALAAVFVSASAMAGTYNEDDAFFEFADTVRAWTGGGLGIGLATTMLLMGGAIGVAKNSPMPALTGIAGAAFLKWGPEIIMKLLDSGALV